MGEYDGAIHLTDGPRRRDLDREALCRDLGLELVTMMSTDRRDTAHFVARLRAAYRRAAERRGSSRRWTTEQPDWWVDTPAAAAASSTSNPARIPSQNRYSNARGNLGFPAIDNTPHNSGVALTP